MFGRARMPKSKPAIKTPIIDKAESWLESELSECHFKDKRIKQRFQNLAHDLWRGLGESIPFACQDWANTKAAYRFFSNERVSENEILNGHFQSTRARFKEVEGTVFIMHDTTEFSYKREEPDLIGIKKLIPQRQNLFGKAGSYTTCGILMHSSLVVTPSGVPLGLAAVKFWTRKKFKGCNALKKHVNPTRLPIEGKESFRWLQNVSQSTDLLEEAERCVHIGDRESDIYELFCMVCKRGTHFLIRTCVDRLVTDSKCKISEEMAEMKVKGLHKIDVRNKKGEICQAVLEIKYRRIKVLPPIGKQKRYPPLELTIIYAEERGDPKNRERISWKLITDLPVTSRQDAIEKLNWYAMRWKIETFHKILKSGCKAETSRFRTAQRITNLISIFCVFSWRIFWMTMINRIYQNAPARMAITPLEIKLLNHLVVDKHRKDHSKGKLHDYLLKIAKLGGYLARNSDPPPGNIVMWRGLMRLSDIQLGFIIGNNCG